MSAEDNGRRGRPRDGTRDQAIRNAVLELLSEEGYPALTVDAVAARAHAGKATIYRRWPGKADLVIDAIAHLTTEGLPHPDTGDVRDDMIIFLNGWREALAGRLGAVAVAVVGELPRSPDLARAFRASLWRQVRETMRSMLRRGVERQQVRPDAPSDLVGELAGAALTYRLIVTGDPLDENFVESLVDDALMPLLRPQRS